MDKVIIRLMEGLHYATIPEVGIRRVFGTMRIELGDSEQVLVGKKYKELFEETFNLKRDLFGLLKDPGYLNSLFEKAIEFQQKMIVDADYIKVVKEYPDLPVAVFANQINNRILDLNSDVTQTIDDLKDVIPDLRTRLIDVEIHGHIAVLTLKPEVKLEVVK